MNVIYIMVYKKNFVLSFNTQISYVEVGE